MSIPVVVLDPRCPLHRLSDIVRVRMISFTRFLWSEKKDPLTLSQRCLRACDSDACWGGVPFTFKDTDPSFVRVVVFLVNSFENIQATSQPFRLAIHPAVKPFKLFLGMVWKPVCINMVTWNRMWCSKYRSLLSLRVSRRKISEQRRAKQFIRTRITIKQPKHKGRIHAAKKIQGGDNEVWGELHEHCAARAPRLILKMGAHEGAIAIESDRCVIGGMKTVEGSAVVYETERPKKLTAQAAER
ncbi:hypothetical protein BC629DRAFT_1443088 [Irpex lacteus]|nr:hypothetical protein BC629DRAFT_1443088 [Irpex lacteus]